MTEAERAWAPILPREPMVIPDNFAWGVASSAFQAEGGTVPNDWVAAARAGRVPPNPGNGFWHCAEADFRLAADLGIRHYRLSVEWSRVEPAEGCFDEAALDRYRRMCDAAAACGIAPWVNLFHFTHPQWVVQGGGLQTAENRERFLRYLERVARALAGHARHFHTQNESMIYVVAGYLLGENPPFLRDPEIAYDMSHHVFALHARGYGILHEIVPEATVATIEVYVPLIAQDEAGIEPARQFDAWYHGAWLRGLATGVVELPGREPVEVPGLRGALDLYGFNYYAASSIGKGGIGPYAAHDPAPVDNMGRYVCPQEMERGLQRVAAALPGMPILVTENGCPTRDERFRIRYIAAHLAAVLRARAAGSDIRGYFHWTAVDNYEWLHGFGEARFGLIGFDPVSLARTVKQSCPSGEHA
ncbi:MAG: glycoside hydrolase family 1 protein [Deltaproteobacteria bacterium]|nr:glycoside hydrolase family 1 protein [Deltaproteobacteria bacterium]